MEESKDHGRLARKGAGDVDHLLVLADSGLSGAVAVDD